MVAPTASFLATGKIQRTREGSASRAAADALVKSQQGCGWDGGSSDHHGTLWGIAQHSVSAAQISFCGKESPWNPLGHHPFSESTQTPVSDGPATGAQKGSCGKEPLLGHCNTQRFRDPDKFLCKRVTMEPFGTSPLFGKHANASVWWPGNGGPEKFLWERATMEPFGASQNIAFSRPR